MNLTVDALGWTLLHFLWQGALVAGLLAAAMFLLRKSSAQTRYLASTVAMFLMLACAIGTLVRIASMDSPVPMPTAQHSTEAPLSSAPASAAPAAPDWTSRIPGYFPTLVYIWIAGVIALSIRSTGGWIVAQRLKRRHVRPAEKIWQQRLARIAERLAISRPVRLCESAIAQVPAVIGWLRPVVLLPAGALSGLTPRQIEALLAHELAHIRRHDYLVNLLQTAVETLFFYHPAVWWVGQRMRAERENCCDDLAVAVCGDALVYARALTQLEHLRAHTPQLAMAATHGSLLDRVRRLIESKIEPQQSGRGVSPDWFTGVAIALSVVSVWAASHPRFSVHFDDARALTVHPALYQPVKPLQPTPAVSPAPAPSKPSPFVTAPEPQEIAFAQTPPPPEAPPPAPQAGERGYVGGLTSAGYKDLSIDQLIQLKIHGVTPEYARQFQALGLKPSIDDLVKFAIHGARPEEISEMKKLGYTLDSSQIVTMRIHGLTPEYAREMKNAGLGTPSFDDLIKFKIHGVEPDAAEQWHKAGVRDLNLDALVKLNIHGASPANVRQIASLGYSNLSSEDVVRMCIHGVDAEFIRKAQKQGFKDLSLDKLIKLKQFGILD